MHLGSPQFAAWFASIMLVWAAVIDGKALRVPNWLTFPMAGLGLLLAVATGGLAGLGTAAIGLALGLILLLPVYSIGGMGAGDVKLLAAVGAWVGPAAIFGAFLGTVFAGGLIAAGQIAWSRNPARHFAMMQTITSEVLTLKDPVALTEIAKARKPTMTLLPYGIPMAIGSIAYFAYAGLLG